MAAACNPRVGAASRGCMDARGPPDVSSLDLSTVTKDATAPAKTTISLHRATTPAGKASSRTGVGGCLRSSFHIRMHGGKEAQGADSRPDREAADGLGRVENRQELPADRVHSARQRLETMRKTHALMQTKAKPGYLDGAPPGSMQACHRESVVQFINEVRRCPSNAGAKMPPRKAKVAVRVGGLEKLA